MIASDLARILLRVEAPQLQRKGTCRATHVSDLAPCRPIRADTGLIAIERSLIAA